MQGTFCDTVYKRTDWTEWYNRDGQVVCSKNVSVSRFVIQKPDNLREYLHLFAALQCESDSSISDTKTDGQSLWFKAIVPSPIDHQKTKRTPMLEASPLVQVRSRLEGWDTD